MVRNEELTAFFSNYFYYIVNIYFFDDISKDVKNLNQFYNLTKNKE